ncbi:hypothetical protein ACIQ7D_27190 [Streptomyces sp. NPDC096310]|uniref:hypothetical protein n=1 Tax=Streptomyces sp. NPDC096310 TaxID=3366082 RepID=UPI00380FCBD1
MRPADRRAPAPQAARAAVLRAGVTVYVVTVVAEGPVNGARVRVVLGARRMYTSEGALSWLRDQAHRVADGLDPDPAAAWLPAPGPGRGVLVPVASYVPDVPTALRSWCDDHRQQSLALGRLVTGERVVIGAADDSGRYTLTAQPAASAVQRHSGAPRRRWWWPFRRVHRSGGRHARTRAGKGGPSWLEALAVTLGAVLGILALAVVTVVKGE